MASTFLAAALNASDNIPTNEIQAEEQKQQAGRRQDPNLESPWERAVRIFNNSLTKDETKKLSLDSCPRASLESFIQQVSTAKETATRKRSKILDRVNDIVVRINLFSKPMDTFSQANQELMFAWGTMKFLMQIVMSEKEISEKLAEAIADIVQIFGRCEQYTQLFASHDRVLESIGVLYADVLNLLVRAMRFYEKGGFKRFVSSTATPFEIKFAPIVADIQKHGAVVENEASMAHAKEQKTENDLQRSFRRTIELQQNDQMSREVRLWLQCSNSASDLQKICESRTTGTCTWLLQKKEYASWADTTQSSMLWIYGIPGSGKSVLASYIIDNLNRASGAANTTPTVYFFCSGRNESQRTSIHILRSLILQLHARCPHLGSFIADTYKASTSRVANDFDELWTLFKLMCNKTTVKCIIDGLDECQDRSEDGSLDRSTFAHNLVKLAKEHRSNLENISCFKVLLTSRNEPDLRIAFHSASDILQTLPISPADVAQDINSFITNRIADSDALSDLPDDMKTTVITRLNENASGMFIWARLMIEQLEATESDEALEEALQMLPTGLSALYDRILTTLAHNFERNDSVRDLGCFILCLVVQGAQPLTLTELSEARCIRFGQQSLSMRRKPRSLANFRRLIEAACSPLIEVQDDGIVQLAHHTTKEYLLKNSELLFKICNPIKTFGIPERHGIDADCILVQICLSYLSFDQFELPLLGVRKRFALKSTSDLRLTHPFLEYAASSWLFHVSRTKDVPYSSISMFIRRPQAITWIEAAITLQGGVEKLATIFEYLPTFGTTAQTVTAIIGADCVAVTEWFESLQRVIFEWGGTLNQTPSEIHFLDILSSSSRSPSRGAHLQKTKQLEDPATTHPNVRPLEEGDSFLLAHPYVYVLKVRLSPWDPFLKRYHWLSMQRMGELLPPPTEGFRGIVREIQICPNHRFIVAVMVGTSHILVAVWSISEEGFDPLPWAENKSVIGTVSTDKPAFGFSHRPSFEGPGWRQSGRHVAFSEDGKIIWTPAGAFDVTTGQKCDIPTHFKDLDVACATWSLHGHRLACIRGKKTLEVYQNDGNLVATFQNEQIEGSIIVDFSKSGRYVLLLQTSNWQHVIFDVHLSSFLVIETPTFAENPFDQEIASYNKDWTILSHSFSRCERYFSFLCDNISHRQPVVLGIWDRLVEKWIYSQIWTGAGGGAGLRPSHAQFDAARSETLHLLLNLGESMRISLSGTPGFIEVDLADKASFGVLKQWHKLNSTSRSDVCLNESGGRVFQRIMYSVQTASVWEDKVEMLVWNLVKAPPAVECRFIVPRNAREFEGWRDGYSQTNGAYGDWYALSNGVSMCIVGDRLYSISEVSDAPTPIRTFDPTVPWKLLLENSPITNEDEGRKELKEEPFWSYFSPNGSLICFYASSEYIVVLDVQSGGLRWCHRLRGRNTTGYLMSKPVFHPTLPMMAWVEQFGKDGRDDFNSLKHCGVYLVDVSISDSIPIRIPDLEVDCRSHLLFSPCGNTLYGAIIGRDDYNFDERKLKFFKIDIKSSPPKPIAYIKALSPIKGPSYCGSPNPADCTIVLKDDEAYFLITVEYKVMIAKIEFDGTVKWKMVASLPGPPASPEAIALSGWNSNREESGSRRLDIVLAAQNFSYATVLNTWDENPGEWDEICHVEHDPSL